MANHRLCLKQKARSRFSLFLCLLGAIASENPQAEAWGYTDEARLRGLRNPQAEAWGYTDEARLRGLIQKIEFLQPDLVLGC
ncbi:hypothetical protein [Laspinema olomoucense]|uniref:hypothetical protein n=1 Tax=Laspinema olomoucense TaxID=3231600 RepID=UPI0021BBB437|nr:hypothetical protein [Laspinema sp. D3c]MCT7993096.1 hypothetical protein [Laspinema sp. D3c]